MWNPQSKVPQALSQRLEMLFYVNSDNKKLKLLKMKLMWINIVLPRIIFCLNYIVTLEFNIIRFWGSLILFEMELV